MFNEQMIFETPIVQNSPIDLVEPSPFSIHNNHNFLSVSDFNYFNETNFSSFHNLPLVNQNQINQQYSDVLTGLEEIDPLTTGQSDLLIGGLTMTNPIKAGSTVRFSYTLRNNGTRTASPSATKYYLSNDSVLDSNDQLLGDDNPGTVTGGTSLSRTDSVNFSGNLNTGTYFFLVVADSNNTNLESNETNNIFTQQFQITKPDLVVDPVSVTAPSSATAGQSFRFNYTIRNQGDAGSSTSITKYYLSTDPILDSSDSYLGDDSVTSLGIDASITRSDSVTLGTNFSSGTYYFLTQVDSNNTSIESNEANNLAVKTINMIGAPDLTVSYTSSLPTSIAAGGIINIPYTLQNLGPGSSSTITTRFYLSTNTTYETTDIEIGSDTVSALSGGASLNRVRPLTINNTIPNGNYYLITRADSSNATRESNETNNLVCSPQTLEITKPDLEISQFVLSAPSNPTIGSTINVSYTLTNQGRSIARDSITRYYLSSDGIFDANDTYLGDDSVSTLVVGASVNRTDSFVLNRDLSNGVYYFLAIADSTNRVAESNESNNLAYQTFGESNIDQPDLVLNPLTGSLVANQGGSLTLSYTLANQGSANALSSTTKFYLSTDTTLDSSDLVLGSDSLTSLVSGASITKEITLPINSNVGTYYLLAQADSEGAVSESDENNNLIYQTLRIVEPPKPDLSFNYLTVPSPVIQNNNLNLSYSILNQGNADAPASLTKFYLSSDATLDSSDLLLGSDNLIALSSNATSIRDLTFGLNNLATGTYYLLAQADSNNIVSESNESNNIISQVFEIIEPPRPDLVINSVAAPSPVNKGSNFVVAYEIKNQGNADAVPSTTRFYLSTDTILDQNDLYLSSDSVGTLERNATSPEDTVLTIGNTVSAGNYYLLAEADGEKGVAESNENNNLSYQPIQITEPGVPDLTINPLALTVNGLNLSVAYTIANQGTLGAATSNTRFYLSSNNTLEATDTLLGSDAVPTLASQSSAVRSVSLRLANNLNAGTYFILAQADSDSTIAESNETNNLASQTISLRSDLTISGLSAANGTNQITQGYGFVPRYTLNNIGNAVSGAATTRYVLSKDSIIGNADDYSPTLLSNGGPDAALAAGVSRAESNDYLVITDALTPGTYNLFAIADSTNVVAEQSETNNATSIPITFSLPPQPDLIVNKLNSPNNANLGGYLNLSYTIRNLDAGFAGYSYINFYLSTDNVVDATDLNIGYHMAASSVPSNIPISRSRSIFLDPAVLRAGTYNLIAMVDPDRGLSESNENNNTLINRITINPIARPDLSIASISAPSSLTMGQLVTIPYQISNSGAAGTRSTTSFYLSADAQIDSNDVLIGTSSSRELGSNQQRAEAASIYLNPALVPTGTRNYFLIARADHNNAGAERAFGIVESNENNNTLAISVLVNNTGVTKFNSAGGYGIVDAASAVSRALNIQSLTDVPNTDRNWGVDYLKAPEVWNAGYTGTGVTVAIVDTGVDYNHPDLVNNIWTNTGEIPGNGLDDDGNGYIDDVRGWNFVENNNAPLDSNGHGTHVAGIVAASRNSIGYTGIAPNAKIMPLRVIGGGDQWGHVNNAIRYAVDNGARVINISLGGSTFDQDGRLRESLALASERGVIVVMAAGNNSAASPLTPASLATQWGIAVGAITNTGAMASYSNKAGVISEIAYVTAPGSSNSTLPNNRYGVMNGTSMASPHVAGVVALMLNANPNLTDAMVRQILTSTAVSGSIGSTGLNNTTSGTSSETSDPMIYLEDYSPFSLSDLEYPLYS